MEEKAVLSIQNISKVFPGVKALDNVSFDAYSGEVLGLIGVNGAGKSTLMNILGGVSPATEGKVLLNGTELTLNTPQQAEQHGIGFIHQEPVMFQYMTVAENIAISRLKGRVNYKRLYAEAKKYLGMMGCDIDPRAKVGDLPIGERQMVEIARALSCGGKVLLFDEPTSTFSYQEKERLFEVIESLKKQGAIIFFISHFLDELEQISDRIVVLRDGKLVVSGTKDEVTKETIIRNMVGGEVVQSDETKSSIGEPVFKVENVSRGRVLKDVSFEIRAGEIVGLWGLMGSGRTELMRAIYGLDKADKGKVYVAREAGGQLEPVPFSKLRDYCGYVTEGRHDDGIFLPWSIWENVAAPNLSRFVRHGLLDFKSQKTATEEYIKKLNIKTPSADVKAEQLSGGNQQKVIMAKWLMRAPKIFLLDEPTRGVDVGAKAEIHKLIHQLASEGTAVLVVSSEIEEISELSDRVLVINRGKITACVDKKEIDKDLLMSYCV